MMKKTVALLLALVLVVGLAACGSKEDKGSTGSEGAGTTSTTADGGFKLSVNVGSEPESIDPARNRAMDGGIMLGHVFEGLMKWVDAGNGEAKLAPGQATTFEKSDIAEDGSVVYTFHLRDDLKWSDGQELTANDFVYSWRRLVNPTTAADYNYMADMVLNAQAIMDGEADVETLGVKAIDDKTFEVTLFYDCPYFLEVTAFYALMPVRQDVTEADDQGWTFKPETYIGNGPMKMKEWTHNANITFVKNEYYYDAPNVTLDELEFKLMDDANSMLTGFRNGSLDFIHEMPVDELPTLIDSGELKIIPQLGDYYVGFNNQAAPFDNALVRRAFSLVIDRNHITENITRAGQIPADAFVPTGINDAGGVGAPSFRDVGGSYYSIDPADYEKNCEEARALLAEAGYPNGEGFPTVEYSYNTNDNHKAIGEALQDMWQTELGVTVKLTNLDWNAFLLDRQQGNYQIARNGWIADYNDPISFLDMFVTGNGNNDPQYSNPEYDAAIQEAKNSADPVVRMAALHRAEDILLKEDAAVAPIYFYVNKYMFNENVEGMFYNTLGNFFFQYCRPAGTPAPNVDTGQTEMPEIAPATPASETTDAEEVAEDAETSAEGTEASETAEAAVETEAEETTTDAPETPAEETAEEVAPTVG